MAKINPKPNGYTLPDEILKSLNAIIKECDYIRKSQFWTFGDVEKHKVFARTGVQVLIKEVLVLDGLFTKHQIGFVNGIPHVLNFKAKPSSIPSIKKSN